jgi:outer membrane protein
MTKINKVITSSLLLFASIHFCTANEFRIGVVDMERIQRESAPSVNAGLKIMKEFELRDLEIKKLSKQAKEIQSYFEKDSMPVMDAEHRSKERELANLNVSLQRMQREFREDLMLRQNEEMALVFSRVSVAIKAIAEAEHYDLILQEAVYRNPQIDITDKILKYLSAEK